MATMTLDQIKWAGAAIRELLQDDETVVSYEYQPGNGTRYQVVFVPGNATAVLTADGELGREEPFGKRSNLVVIANFGTAYPLEDGAHPFPSYIAEKWAEGRITDACALHLLLSAVAGAEPVCSLEEAGVR